MATMEAPPPYAITAPPVSKQLQYRNSRLNPPPPKYYSLPPTFSIGRKHTSHLVNVAQIKGHLALLRSFSLLKDHIRSLHWLPAAENTIDNMPFEHDARWVWFVSLAVERFTIWCESLTSDDSSLPAADFLPPTDVLMVWHAYLLNPSWYAEDSTRLPIMRNLYKATHIFSTSIGSDLQTILAAEPTAARLELWFSRTGRAFDALSDAYEHQIKTFPCPGCKHPIKTPYMKADGTGYLQHDFTVICDGPQCQMRRSNGTTIPVDRTILRARKFLDDLFRDGTELQAYMPGTVRTPYLNIDTDKSKRIKTTLHHSVVIHYVGQRQPGLSQKQWAAFVVEKTLFNFKELRATVAVHTSDTDRPLVDRAFSAYTDHRPFSVDLVGAVVRQGSFLKKMEELKWTKPDYFGSKDAEVTLQHALARYHAFLDLISATPTVSIVPTLDIDLVWHTHQLMGGKYNSDCKQTVGKYVDHDDKMQESKIVVSFETTCVVWKERFGLPYIHCGCPVPGKTIGRRFSNIMSTASHSRSHDHPYLVPPERSDIMSATHPSEHNSVIYIGSSEGRKHVVEDQSRRREKLLKLQDKNKLVNKYPEHQVFGTPFLLPMPFHYGPGCSPCAGHAEGDPDTGGIAACVPSPATFAHRSI